MKFLKLLLLEASPLVFSTCSFFFLLCMCANTHALFMQRIWLVHARLLVMGTGDITRWREVAQRVNTLCASTSTRVLIPRTHGKPGTVMCDCNTVASTAKEKVGTGTSPEAQRASKPGVCFSPQQRESFSNTMRCLYSHVWIHTHHTHTKREAPSMKGSCCI